MTTFVRSTRVVVTALVAAIVAAAIAAAAIVAVASPAVASPAVASAAAASAADHANAARGTVDSGATEIALTHRGDSWWVSPARIELRSATGELTASVDAQAGSFGVIVRFAVSPQDDSLWAMTDAGRLIHVNRDGTVSGVTALPAGSTSLTIAQDAAVWVATPDAILHFAASGHWSASLPLASDGEDRAIDREAASKADARDAEGAWRQILVDSLRDQGWIVERQRLTRFSMEMRTAATSIPLPVDCEPRDAALDGLLGNVFVLCDRTIAMFDAAGVEVSRLDLGEANAGAFDRLVHDPRSGDLVASGAGIALRIGAHDRLELRGHVDPALATVRPAPFRIDPTVTLLRPPDGGAMSDPRQEIVLKLGAQCPSGNCQIPDTYVQGLQLTFDINGVRQTPPAIDIASRRAVAIAGGALRPGTNRIDAAVRDRFGHTSRMRTASLTLLDSAIESADEPPTLVAKAANKAPTVTLSAPVSGSVFTAGSDVTLSANASDSDGTIARVDFYRGGSNLIGTSTAAPYSVVWRSAVAGSHSLTARAVDNRNGSKTSAPVAISVVDNRPPSIALTMPTDGAFYVVGNPITLGADARDADGSISRVEFFDGATSLAVVTASPWTWTWSQPTPGVHTISVRATDDRGATTTSAAVNVRVGAAPRVVISAPAACSVADAPANLWVTVDVYSESSAIDSVEVFDGAKSIGAVLQPPWQFVIANASAGTHSITARAIDMIGLSATSRPAMVEVRAANQAPAVSLTSPAEGASYPSGATVTLSADATDPDGTITTVLFHTDGGYPIGTVTQLPYRVDWKNLASGAYTVYARVVDDRAAVTTSLPVHFNVASNVPPVVSLVSPVDGATFGAPATISVAASASDSDGSIARVDFYSGATLLGTDTSEPFAFEWSAVGAGTYSLSARAYDNSGAMTASAPVSVTVAANLPPTVALSSPAAGAEHYAPATINLAATASDADGAVARVEFHANGSLIGTATAAPYTLAWIDVPAGTYSVTATAYDAAGVATTTPPTTFVVKPSVSLNLVDLADGATIHDDRVRVRGYFAGPDNSSITVNGVVAHIDDLGFFQLNDVPLVPGINSLDAVVTTQDGQSATRSVAVNSSGPGAFVVNASPTEGIESLPVTFTTENRSGAAFKRIVFDLEGDGYPDVIATPAEFADGTFAFVATYPIGTWNTVIRAYDDRDQLIYETQKSIVVLIPSLHASRVRAVYEEMLTRLGAGNVTGALTAFTGSAYAKYEAIFSELGPDLATIVGRVGTVTGMTVNMDLAELNVTRDTLDGPQQFMVYLIRSEDGIWRIDGM